MTRSSLPSAPSVATPADRFRGARLAADIAARTSLWLPRVQFRDDTRWTALLDTDDVLDALGSARSAETDLQIWLLTWLPGQGTPLHDHGASSGAFAVARGTLTERVVAVARGAAPHGSTVDLAAGRVRSFGPHYVHQVTNTRPEPAVSVHVYAPGLTVMNTYVLGAAGLVRTGTERAGVNW